MSNGSCNVTTELSAAQRYVAANYVFGVAASVACLVMIVLVKASFNQEKCAARVDAQYIYRHTDPVRMRNN